MANVVTPRHYRRSTHRSKAIIYLDYNATTPVDPDVVGIMAPFWSTNFGNAGSAHEFGLLALSEVEAARETVAQAIGVRPSEVIWTSGATESNHLALLGFAYSAEGLSRSKVVPVATEHKSVLEPLESLARRGVEVVVLPVCNDGLLDLELFERHLSKGDTGLVSVMAANNETGVIQRIEEIAQLSKAYGARFHTDATQALGKTALPGSLEHFDYLSFSGHKIYGPKGVGILIARRGSPLEPLQLGGGQEAGRRSGTINVPGVVGFAHALRISIELFEAGEAARQARLIADLVSKFEVTIDGVTVVSGNAPRISNTVNLRFIGADADAVLANVPDLCLSTGSACNERTPGPSHVLSAMKLGEGAEQCIRFSIGRSTTSANIDEVVQRLAPAIRRVRSLV